MGPLIVGLLQNKQPNPSRARDGFLLFNLYFVVTGAICVVMAIWTIILDMRTGLRLHKIYRKTQPNQPDTKKSITKRSFRI